MHAEQTNTQFRLNRLSIPPDLEPVYGTEDATLVFLAKDKVCNSNLYNSLLFHWFLAIKSNTTNMGEKIVRCLQIDGKTWVGRYRG